MADGDFDVVARFASMLASLNSVGSVTHRFCEAGQLLLDADGAAITLSYDQLDRHIWTATNELATLIEDAQEVAGEGPGFEAQRSGAIVSGRFGLTVATPWPLLEDRIASTGFIGTILAVPLLVDRTQLGVLVAHRWATALRFDQAVATFLSRTIGIAILDELSPKGLEDELTHDWTTRALVHQATGMVIAQLGIQPGDALSLLRGHAYAHGLMLTTVAADVLARRTRFDNTTIEGD